MQAELPTLKTRLRALALTLLLGSTITATAAPTIQHWQTSSGARVYFVPAPELPMVDIAVAFDAGSARDGDQHGLACLTNSVMGEGIGELDADARADAIGRLGASISHSCGRDMATVSLRSLTRPAVLAEAVQLLGSVLRQPRFDAGDLSRVRNQTLAVLRQQQQSAGSVAALAFYPALYGAHPYAHNTLGDKHRISGLQREQLLAFHRRYYQAGNAVIAIVGDLDRSQAEALADDLIGCPDRAADDGAGNGTGDCSAAPPLPTPALLTRASDQRIDFPASQNHVLQGAIGMARGDPDYFTLYVGNYILGGSGLVSRLSEEIRERRGLSYSVYSYFSPMRMAGPFVLGLQTAAKNRDEAISVLRATLERFVTDGPSAEELEAAHLNLSGGFPLRIASNSQMVNYLAVIGFYDLPLDYLDRWVGRVEAVTVEDIRDAFRRRVHPERMATIVVGRGAGD